MFFTQEDYKKIQKWLLLNSVKDTEFQDSSEPFDGDETIAFVQRGRNVKAPLKDLIDQFLLLGVKDFLNISTQYKENYISLGKAIMLIPFKRRKIGQVITFLNEDGVWEIYQFKGTNVNQWNNITLWENVLSSIIESNLGPDEEDLTSFKDGGKVKLKFKDKDYNKDIFSGLGRVYLRKNVVKAIEPSTDKPFSTNLLTDQMISKPNTIYIIQYDYDLNQQGITIPENCVLQFEGGSISNGKMEGRNTRIINSTSNSFINIETTGTWNTELSEPIEGEIKTINVVRDIIANQNSITNIENNIDNIEEDIKGIDTDLSGLHEDFNNLPIVDEEDITVGEDNFIRFKDKEYNPEEFSGLGRVYLRKNIVADRNILTQEMINKPNIRYIIQYNYTLLNGTIKIPPNSILEFSNGTINNGSIEADNTILDYPYLANIGDFNIIGSYTDVNKFINRVEQSSFYITEEADFIKLLEGYPNTKTINLVNNKVYKFDAPITIMKYTKDLVINGNGAVLEFSNKTGGLIAEDTSGNNQYCTLAINNLTLQGTNKVYPKSQEDMPDRGIGLLLNRTNGCNFHNVRFYGFDIGVKLIDTVGSVFTGNTSIMYNRIGLYLTGWANTNKFFGTKIRENRSTGVFIGGVEKAPYTTNNCFYGCYVESNVPFNTSYDVESVGIHLDNAFDNIFDGLYSENHKTSILLTRLTRDNMFDKCRLNSGAKGNDTIVLKDIAQSNMFTNILCATDSNLSTVEISDVITQHLSSNKFLNFKTANFENIYDKVECSNYNIHKPYIHNIGPLCIPTEGIKKYISFSGKESQGNYDKETKTLSVYGLSFLQIGPELKEDIEIEKIENTKKNSLLFISNYQPNHKIIIKSDSRIGSIILNKEEDAVLSSYSDFIVFFVTPTKKLIEIGRNIKTEKEKEIVSDTINVDLGTIEANSSKTIIIKNTRYKMYRAVTISVLKAPEGLFYQSISSETDGEFSVVFYNNTDTSMGLSTRSISYMFLS